MGKYPLLKTTSKTHNDELNNPRTQRLRNKFYLFNYQQLIRYAEHLIKYKIINNWEIPHVKTKIMAQTKLQ